MKKVTVKQLMLLSLFVAMAWSAGAQMKVGDNPNTINKGSVLELEAKDKGVLYPRVALTASNVWAPLQGTAVVGMTVYNTATVTATTSATISLSPGFYFWEGAKWNKLATNAEVDEGAEWADGATASGTQLIYANQAKTVGNDVVITDLGRVGFGIIEPRNELDVIGTGRFQAQSPINARLGAPYILSHGIVLAPHNQNVKGVKTIDYQGLIGFLNEDDKIEFSIGLDTDNLGTEKEDKEILFDFVDESANKIQILRIASFKSTGKVVFGSGFGYPQGRVHIDINDHENYPALVLSGGTPQKGDLAVPSGESIDMGFWDDDAKTFTEVITVFYNENVGIGKTRPTEKLEVNGNVKAISFIAANMKTFPDYVFETYYDSNSELNNAYSFMSLEEVEAFTKANKHLPGYDSASAIAEKGSLNIVDTQLKNVEKIEELYLHTIAQEKRIAAQQKEIAELKTLVQQLLEK